MRKQRISNLRQHVHSSSIACYIYPSQISLVDEPRKVLQHVVISACQCIYAEQGVTSNLDDIQADSLTSGRSDMVAFVETLQALFDDVEEVRCLFGDGGWMQDLEE